MSSNFLDIVLRVLGSSASEGAIKGTAQKIDDLGDTAKRAASETAKVGKDTSGFANLEAKAKSTTDALKKTEDQTERLNATFGKARDWGAGLALAGAGGIVLSNSLVQIAQEGARADAKLEAMAKKRGEGGRVEELSNWASELSKQAALVDDDPIKEATAGLYGFGVNADQIKGIMPGLIGQSRLYNQSLDQTAMAFGKAFASGNAGALKRVGVTISDADVQHVKDANTETERSARLYEVVKRSMDSYALSMTEGMSEAEIAMNRQKNATDEAFTAIGTGSADAQAWINNLGISMLTLVTTNKSVAASAGWTFTIASNLAAAGGSLVAFTGQVGQTYLAMMAYRNAKLATATATGLFATAEWDAAFAAAANATAQGGAAVATTGVGVAAGGAAVKVGLLASAQLAATATLAGASLGMIALFTGIGIAVAVVITKLAQMFGLIDRNRNLVEEFKRGWDVITGNGKEAETSVGREMRQKDLDLIKTQAADMRTNGKTEAEIDDYVQKRTQQVETHWAAEFKKHGDDKDYAASSEAAGAARKQAEAMTATVIPSTPAIDMGITPDSGLAVGGVATAAAASVPASQSAANDPNAIQKAIDTAQSAASNAKTPDEKKKAAETVRNLKAAKTAAEKADRDATKKAALTNKGLSGEYSAGRRGDIDEIKGVLDERKDIEKDKLEQEVEAVKKQIEMHQISKDAGQKKIDQLQESHEHLMRALDSSAEAKEKAIEAQIVMSEAEGKAATQTTDEAAATMKVAAANAARLMRSSRRAAARGNREAAKVEAEVTGTSDTNMFANFAKRTGSFVSSGGGMFNPNAGRGQTYTAVPSVKTDPLGNTVIQFAPIPLRQGGMDSSMSTF